MSNPSDIKPWYASDIANCIRGLYAAKKISLQFSGLKPEERERHLLGALAAWSAVLISTGTDPGKIFTPEDIALMAKNLTSPN